ncbi:MAG: PVC-type heme-binding CxxCH protein [Planctomycetota bacterium]
MLKSIIHLLWLTAVSAAEPKPSPLTPADAVKTFSLPDGFVIELVAAEPEVRDPVAIAWDAAGRMYVAEMGDYPTRNDGGFIKRLEDREGDGTFETSVLFAGPLPFPTSILPLGNGILVSAAPDILYIEDTDGDGKADRREVILTGFGEGNQQLRVNGLTRSIDHWIHGANGRSNGNIVIPTRPELPPLPLNNHDFRFKTLNGPVERTAGFAQFGKAFDRWGNHFVNWNTIPIRQVVVGQQYLDRNPILTVASSMLDISDPKDGGRIYPITAPQTRFNREPTGAFNASCGLTVDRGGIFQREFAHCAYVCEPLGNLVHRMILKSEGVTFRATRGEREQASEFLASSDPWFRPVNLTFGPDGSLYVVDFYREWVEHPQFVPDELEKGIDFTRGVGLGRIYRVRPKGPKPAPIPTMSELTSQELVNSLSHPYGWRRETAQRLLLERKDRNAIEPLRRMAEAGDSPLGRLHALWTLEGLGELTDAEIEKSLEDPEANLRRHALIMSEPRLQGSDQLFQAAARLAEDGDPAVRFQLACSIGASHRPEVVRVLAKLASLDCENPWARLGIQTSLESSNSSFLASWIANDNRWQLEPTAPRLDFVAEVAELSGVRNQADDIRELAEWIGRSDRRENAWPRLAALLGLRHGLLRHGIGVEKRIAELGEPDAEQTFVGWLAMCRNWSEGVEVPLAARLLAIRLLATDPSAATLKTLIQLAAECPSMELRLAAIQALGRRTEPSIAGELVKQWPDAGAGIRRALASAILRHPVRFMALIQALEEGTISPGELDLESRQMLLQAKDAVVRDKAATLFASSTSGGRAEIVSRYGPATSLSGKPDAGRSLFQKNCSTCHRSEGRGPLVGPELTGLATKTPAQLVVDILDPNREVLPNYVSFVAVTKDGEIRTGLLASESDNAVTLRKAEGATETLLRSELEEFRATGRSLMPEGFEQNMSLQDLADLIAYLRRTQ